MTTEAEIKGEWRRFQLACLILVALFWALVVPRAGLRAETADRTQHHHHEDHDHEAAEGH